MRGRALQLLLVLSVLWLSWLLMMLIHESGHALAAILAGGRVQRIIWHPATLSRTDVHPNPRPLLEVAAGPLFGSLVPLLLAGIASATRMRIAYLLWSIAGFCLIANGGYIGAGAVNAVGDASQLLALGAPRWALAVFGCATMIPGFWIWHRVSPKLGFGKSPNAIDAHHAWGSFIAAMVITIVGFIVGQRSG